MKSRREGKCSDPCESRACARCPSLTGLLERLVAIDTQNPPGREAEAAALLASEFEAIGFATEIRPVADGRANVVGRIDDSPGPCFAFNSHMNTVPVGGGWTSDPFRLTEQDGKLFGRGAGDAKRPIVGTAEAGRPLRRRATYGAARWS
jgi:succinyl-diaminopimelate desuccinylase